MAIEDSDPNNEPQSVEIGNHLKVWLPGRPAMKVKGVAVEIVLSRDVPFAWEFGDSEIWGDLMMLARDEQGHAIETTPDNLFLGDYESDPEYQLLIRYANVAVDEAIYLDCDSEPVCHSNATIGDFIIERPLVPEIRDAIVFDPGRCRVWRSGSSWDGVTRLGEAVAAGLLSQEDQDTMIPSVTKFIRHSSLEAALGRALEPFPDKSQLFDRIRPLFREDTE